jgi:hypothetical protein
VLGPNWGSVTALSLYFLSPGLKRRDKLRGW